MTAIALPDLGDLQVRAGKLIDAIQGKRRNEQIFHVVEAFLALRHEGVMACSTAVNKDLDRISGDLDEATNAISAMRTDASPTHRTLSRLFGWKKGRS